MPRIYQLYIASNLLIPFVMSTIFFVGFLMTFELFRIMQLLTARDIDILFVLKMMHSIALTLIPMAIPLSIYFSTIYCMSKLCADSEYIAIRAMGVKKNTMLIPFFVIAILTAINTYFLAQEIVPNAHRDVRLMLKKISSASLIEGIKSGQFFTSIENVVLFANKVDETSKDLQGVYLNLIDTAKNTQKVISADSGKIIYNKNEQTGIEVFKLFLKNGNMSTFQSDGNFVDKILFGEYLLPITEKSFSYETSTREIMMNRNELTQFVDQGLDMALANNYSKRDFFNAKYEYWNRINTPLLCILLVFVGFSLGVKSNRGKNQNSNAKGILVLIVYYILYFAMVSMAKDGKIFVPIAIFLPNLVLFIYGYRQYRNLDWQG